MESIPNWLKDAIRGNKAPVQDCIGAHKLLCQAFDCRWRGDGCSGRNSHAMATSDSISVPGARVLQACHKQRSWTGFGWNHEALRYMLPRLNRQTMMPLRAFWVGPPTVFDSLLLDHSDDEVQSAPLFDVGIHVRTFAVDLKEGVHKAALGDCTARVAARRIHEHQDFQGRTNMSIFIASDSAGAKQSIAHVLRGAGTTNYISSQVELHHSSRDGVDSEKAMDVSQAASYLDWWALSRARKLVVLTFVRGNRPGLARNRSTFSSAAAARGGVTQILRVAIAECSRYWPTLTPKPYTGHTGPSLTHVTAVGGSALA